MRASIAGILAMLISGTVLAQTAPPVDFQLPPGSYPVVTPAAPAEGFNAGTMLNPPVYSDPSTLPAPYNGQPAYTPYPAYTPAPPPQPLPPQALPVEAAAPAEAVEVVEEVVDEGPPQPTVPWYDPGYWVGPWWTGSFEVGINGATGNSDAQSLRTGFELARQLPRAQWDIRFIYSKVEANQVETQHNALMFSNWDYKLANPRWSWFTKSQIEYDEFKDFDLRLAVNTGIGYVLIDTPRTKFKPRFGAGVSREIGGIDDEYKPEAVFGFDFAHDLSERSKLAAVFDFFPTWEDFSDHRWVLDAGWEYVISEPRNLSLKLGVIDRYDSTPNGAESNDLNYSALLLWKL